MTFQAPAAPLPAAGGTAGIPVQAERECTWTAQSGDPWLSITAGASGQGNGTVEVAAAPNADPVARTGGIMLNGSRAQVLQSASECRYTLSSGSASFGQAGGAGSVEVRASSALCTWTATASADWIAISSGANSKGSAAVAFTVAPSAGPPRSATLTIAGLSFEVTQTEGCTYTIAPATFAAGASGATSAVTVTTLPGCAWTTANSVSWISLTGASGIGTGTVGFTVAPTTGPARTGTLMIAGQPFTVTQSPGCAYDVSPLSHSVDASGGTRTVTVNAAAGCAWTAASNVPWITITAGASGSGTGGLTFAVAATAGPSRTGSIVVGGRTVTVVQGEGCTVAISPETLPVPAAGGDGSVSVSAGAGCAWTAASRASWITITSGASGSGSGTVSFKVASTTGPPRSGVLTIADRTLTVQQSSGCGYTLSPRDQTVPSGAATGSFSVSAAAGCTWTATPNAPWLSVTSGSSGTGPGTVQFAATANSGAARSGTITAGDQAFTVTQGSGCTFSIAPATQPVAVAGGTGSVTVTTAAGCAWTAASNAAWITVTKGDNGSGAGTVEFRVDVNATGAPRAGTITIGGQTFTVDQAGA